MHTTRRILPASLPVAPVALAFRYTTGCSEGGSRELRTIQDGGHILRLSPTFTEHVVEWLLAHTRR